MPSPRVSAGLLLYRRRGQHLEVLLAHPGGPFFKNKDDGHWTIPKGEIDDNEEPLSTAIREFREEIGIDLDPAGKFIDLGSIRQKAGKTVHAWAVEGRDAAGRDAAPSASGSLDLGGKASFQCQSHFTIEWPPKSGKFQAFPEIDRAEFFDLSTAKTKINPAQIAFLDRLETSLR
jgi:predicted NUDIX family NTP pyrophosphohydrolase